MQLWQGYSLCRDGARLQGWDCSFSPCLQGDCQPKWPRSACEELRCTVVWDIGGLPSGAEEVRLGSERAEHPQQPECGGLGGLQLGV